MKEKAVVTFVPIIFPVQARPSFVRSRELEGMSFALLYSLRWSKSLNLLVMPKTEL